MDMDKIFLKDACPTSMGGQAVLEGIMMRGDGLSALSLRLPDGNIKVNTTETKTYGKWMKIPIVRGCIAFFDSLVMGMRMLMESARNIEDEEAAKQEPQGEETQGAESAILIALYLSVVLSLIVTIGIFIILPTWLASFLKLITNSALWINFTEGIIRIALFIGYVWAISYVPDINRMFQYHGAEHKAIHAYENLPEGNSENQDLGKLTVDFAKGFPRLHPRCGTSFLMFVFIIAFALHFMLGWPVLWVRIITRLLLLPVIAGLSYELLKWAGRSDSRVVKILSMPGLGLQMITTKEPDDSMLEVAITSIKAVCDAVRKTNEENK